MLTLPFCSTITTSPRGWGSQIPACERRVWPGRVRPSPLGGPRWRKPVVSGVGMTPDGRYWRQRWLRYVRTRLLPGRRRLIDGKMLVNSKMLVNRGAGIEIGRLGFQGRRRRLLLLLDENADAAVAHVRPNVSIVSSIVALSRLRAGKVAWYGHQQHAVLAAEKGGGIG